jgi:hypothetical protein
VNIMKGEQSKGGEEGKKKKEGEKKDKYNIKF